MRFLALCALFAILLAPLAARADVVNGMTTIGPLAQSLRGKPVVVRVHADW